MLTAEDSIFEKVSDALYLLSENREIAEQCLRMQEAAATEKYRQEQIEKMNNALAKKDSALAQKEAELEQLRAQLRKYQEQV